MRFSRKTILWAAGIGFASALTIGAAAPILAQVSGDNSTPGIATPLPSNERRSTSDFTLAAAGNARIDDSLEFRAITPCRVFDSRVAGGILGDNTTRTAATWGGPTSVTSQGGVDCGLTSRTRAVHVNITAISVTGGSSAGYLTVYPFGVARPNASIVNFTPGQTIANAATFPICPDCTSDLNVFNAFGTTHVIIDILGYYEPPFVAEINADGTVASATPGISASRTVTGGYQVNFPRNVSDCASFVSLGAAAASNATVGFISSTDRLGVSNAVFVSTMNVSGTSADLPFKIRLTC